MPKVKSGDLVTLSNSNWNTHSNTYEVHKVISDTTCLLQHPLALGILREIEIKELNHAIPTLQSSVEKCLFFCQKHKQLLSHTDIADLDAFSFYFILRKDTTNKHRAQINSLCGKISSKLLSNSLEQATLIIRNNEVLLDEFNRILFNVFKKFVINPQEIVTKNQRYSIFELSGFLMAQLDERHKGL